MTKTQIKGLYGYNRKKNGSITFLIYGFLYIKNSFFYITTAIEVELDDEDDDAAVDVDDDGARLNDELSFRNKKEMVNFI